VGMEIPMGIPVRTPYGYGTVVNPNGPVGIF